LFSLPFEQLVQAAGDHVREVLVVNWRVELAVLDRIPLLILGMCGEMKMFPPGLLQLNRLLGAVTTFGGVAAAVCLGVTTFGGVAAAICLGGLLAAALGCRLVAAPSFLFLLLWLAVAGQRASFFSSSCGCVNMALTVSAVSRAFLSWTLAERRGAGRGGVRGGKLAKSPTEHGGPVIAQDGSVSGI
jgi:hypothetical protein